MHSLHNGKRYSLTSPAYRSSGHDPIDSDEEDPEVLPSASSATFPEGASEAESGAVWRDGQWFNVLDEQYLLPVFSNAIASRRQANRKAMRSTARLGQFADTSLEDGPERDLGALSPNATPRSAWDSPGIANPEVQSGNGNGANGGGGPPQRNVKGFVHTKQAPSLSGAVSSLLSSIVSSSLEAQSDTGTITGAGDSRAGNRGINRHSSSASSNIHHTSSRGSSSPSFFSSSDSYKPISASFHAKRRDSGDPSLALDYDESQTEWEDTPLAGSRDSRQGGMTTFASPVRQPGGLAAGTGPSVGRRYISTPLSFVREEHSEPLARRQAVPVSIPPYRIASQMSNSAGPISLYPNKSQGIGPGHQ